MPVTTVVRLRPDLAETWLADLESGNFPQGRNLLRARTAGAEADGFCCLAVRCERAVEAGILTARRVPMADLRTSATPPLGFESGWLYEPVTPGGGVHMGNGTEMPPAAEVAWAYDIDINDAQAMSIARAYDQTMASMNDGGSSFAEIAAYIRANLV